MYAEGRKSGESEGSLPCSVLDSNSNSLTQGIVNSHREFWKVGARIPPTRRDSQLQGLKNISGWYKDIRGQCWERQGLVVGGEDTRFFLSDSAQKRDQPVSVVFNFSDYAVHTYQEIRQDRMLVD